MPLSLLSLFDPPVPARCVAFTGAGGKTSLLAALAAALTGEGRPVVVATTTHIWPPNRPALSPLRGDGPFFCRDRALPDLAAELLVLFRARPGRALVVGRDLDAATGKVRGLEPRELCALRALLDDYTEMAKHDPDSKTIADALARFHYRICTLSGNQLFPLIMNAFRGVGSTLWEDSANFWGVEALLEQGKNILDLLEKGDGETAADYLNSLFDHYLENMP